MYLFQLRDGVAQESGATFTEKASGLPDAFVARATEVQKCYLLGLQPKSMKTEERTQKEKKFSLTCASFDQLDIEDIRKVREWLSDIQSHQSARV